MTAQILTHSAQAIKHATSLLSQGELVAFPTETVYGLGADATNDRAVKNIYKTKGRPSNNPLIIHLADIEQIEEFAILDETSRQLGGLFWPGPFTVILKRKADCKLAPTVTAGLDTIAVRIPAHALARDLIRSFGKPIAAPSANPSGKLSPTHAHHVLESLGHKLPLILEGGACEQGVESTIIQCEADHIKLLRPGTITRQQIQQASSLEIINFEDAQNPTAPGQLKSHYAPHKPVYLNVTSPATDHAYLAFGTLTEDLKRHNILLNLSSDGNLAEAAQNLFDMLHQLDHTDATAISVAPIEDKYIGHALNDRLRRAAYK